RGGVAASQSKSHSLRSEFDDDALTHTLDDDSDSRERNAHLNAKYSLLLENGHSLVTGAEADVARRTETHTTLPDGRASPGHADDARPRRQSGARARTRDRHRRGCRALSEQRRHAERQPVPPAHQQPDAHADHA